MRTFLIIFILLVFFSLDHQSQDNPFWVGDSYQYAGIEKSNLTYCEQVYLPIHANSYFMELADKASLLATVYIENKSRVEPIYILSADYYNSNGILSEKLIENTIRIDPLNSNFIMLNSNMLTNSPGLMVLVNWGTKTIDKKPNIYIELSYNSTSGKNTIKEEGIVISDQDEIQDRRPL